MSDRTPLLLPGRCPRRCLPAAAVIAERTGVPAHDIAVVRSLVSTAVDALARADGHGPDG